MEAAGILARIRAVAAMGFRMQASSSISAADVRRTRILAQVRAVPAGRVASYGAIARRAGLPRAARLVAQILASSGDEDHDVPWHRIVRSDGRIAFPLESASFIEQCQRLRAEGIEVRSGRVRLDHDDVLDRALWGDGSLGD